MFEQISAVLGRLEFRVSSGRRLNSSSRVVHLDGTVEKLSDWLLRCRGRLDEIRAGQAAAAGKLHVPHSSSPEALDALAALREEVTVAEATIDYRISGDLGGMRCLHVQGCCVLKQCRTAAAKEVVEAATSTDGLH